MILKQLFKIIPGMKRVLVLAMLLTGLLIPLLHVHIIPEKLTTHDCMICQHHGQLTSIQPPINDLHPTLQIDDISLAQTPITTLNLTQTKIPRAPPLFS